MGYLSVLLADDEELTRLDIKEHLRENGYIVCAETGNGIEVLELARMTNPDIALLDIRMPGMDGIEVAKQLRSIGIPTVLMTAYNKPGFINRAEKVGVYGYLNKPLKEQDVIPALQIAYGRWNEMLKLSKEVDLYKRKIEDFKCIDRAKSIYARERGISEYDAHGEILRISMNSGEPLVRICKEIIRKYIAQEKQ